MKKLSSSILIFLFFISFSAFSQVADTNLSFYTKSIHFTNRGIEYVYSKESGGLERLTGISGKELGCFQSKCHATNCDQCHLKTVNGKSYFSKDAARDPKVCVPCHGEPEKDNPDVHYKKGMQCMDCHTAREIHGDGTEYKSYNEPGFFDVKCTNCHSNISNSSSHSIHKDKLDCAVCHTAETITCLNCHVDSRLDKKKAKTPQLKNLYFLVNHDGKIKLANMLSYVYQNKTMLTFAPNFSHTIKKDGLKCAECHGSKIAKEIANNTFKLVRWENNELKGAEGVVPVLENFKWNLVFMNWVDSSWVPISNPPEPIVQYSGYCTPLTKEQFAKLK
jgi:hypothetical protein